jgi:betaine-aldehyde dehydrogenase
MQTYLNFIEGHWQNAESGELLEVYDPGNGNLVSRAQASTLEDANRAVDAASDSFEASDWSQNPAARSRALLKLSEALNRNESTIAELMVRESGKILSDAIFEVGRAAMTLEYYAGLARNVFGSSTIPTPTSISIMLRQPVGVVSIIVPWNAPMVLLMRSLAPALAAGNTVIIKPASATSGTIASFVSLVDQIQEIPKGTINMVTGSGNTVGKQLVVNKRVNMVSFTGDTSTGKEIMRLAADDLKKLSLELGGKSPNIVFSDADFSMAIKGVLTGANFSYASQICYAGTRVLLDQSIHDKFLASIGNELSRLRLGHGLQKGVDVGPIINQKQMERVMRYIEMGKKDAKLAYGGERAMDGELAKGNFLKPTVFDEVPVDSPLAQEEIFGPVLSVISFRNLEEALSIANSTPYGLAAAIWTSNINTAMKAAKAVKAGTVWINTYGKNYHMTEQGGTKQSGFGRLYGLEGLREFTELKHISIEIPT